MIVAFGALVAAFIPIITGIVGVGLTMLLVTLSAKFMDVQQSATAINVSAKDCTSIPAAVAGAVAPEEGQGVNMAGMALSAANSNFSKAVRSVVNGEIGSI